MSKTSREQPGLSFTTKLATDTILPLHIGHSIVYVGPSITPLSELNMAYKIYSVDGNYSGSSNVSMSVVLL